MPMTTNDFWDLMPHRIKVTGSGGTQGYDDYGRPIGTAPVRYYKCLIDDSTSEVRSADGEQITVALTAYVWPVPVDENGNELDQVPVDIESDDTVEVISPRPAKRPVSSIERHYDSVNGVGYLHNIVLRFT